MLDTKDNEATDECLLEYAKKFKEWCEELKNSPLKIDYANYHSDYTAVSCTFNTYCKKNYCDHEPITTTEYRWFERCANNGIAYIKEKDAETKTHSYDFKNQYGIILDSDNYIPTKAGAETTLDELPSNPSKLKEGFYHVSITSDNDDFHVKNVVRVQTDSISFTKPQSFADPNLVLEEKTTGTIYWRNVNSYHNKTTGYKTRGYD
eukprot:gene11736-13182_t